MKPKSLLRDFLLFFLVVLLFVVVLGVMASYGVSLPLILCASFVFGLVLLLLLPRLLRDEDPKGNDRSSSNFRF
jgi:membrane protein implicated in regulation of membrane protease activity